jgi:serine/threonine protein kinase
MFDDNWNVQVVDFAFARDPQDGNMSVLGGEPAYIPPEVHRGSDPSTPDMRMRADVWAFGMILFEIITGKKPYEGYSDSQIAIAIGKDQKPRLPQGDDLVYAIYDGCVSSDPDQRPEFFHVVSALMNYTEPVFPGENSAAYIAYRDEVFAATERPMTCLSVTDPSQHFRTD